jgi:acetyl esterase
MKAKAESKFQFVCQLLDYPVLDMATSPLQKPHPKGSLHPQLAMIFDACYVDPAQAMLPYVSPVYASRDELHGLPPALIILAGRDSLHDEGLKYGELLKSAGVAAECVEYPNALHGFTLKPSKDTMDAVNKMIGFLRKYIYA